MRKRLKKDTFPSKFAMEGPRFSVRFYRTDGGTEPVKEYFRTLPAVDRKSVGTDIKQVQFGWPLGMPLVRKIERNLWELRTNVSNGIVRTLFTIWGHNIVLLHAFQKKSRKLPLPDLATARIRLRNLRK